jgi:protein TonB
LAPADRTPIAVGEAAAAPVRIARPARRKEHGPRAVALTVAVAMQMGLVFFLLRAAPVPVREGERKVEVVLLQTPEKPPDPPPPPIPPPPAPPTPHLVPPTPVIEIAPAKPLPPVFVPPTAPAAPTAITPPPPPPPPPVQSAATEDSTYNAAVRAAVFAAHHIPDSARLMAIFGDVRVGFTLRDGTPGNVRLIAPSGHEVLDTAALTAVRDARYPQPPEALRGRTLTFEITLYHSRGGP